eukprot:1648698-Pyramimonas_sp.AAC.1
MPCAHRRLRGGDCRPWTPHQAREQRHDLHVRVCREKLQRRVRLHGAHSASQNRVVAVASRLFPGCGKTVSDSRGSFRPGVEP